MPKKSIGLGRGLDAIFLNNAPVEEENSENRIIMAKIAMIDPKSDQPRKYFDQEALEELAESILKNGLLQPILVREYGEGRYQIIAGERRYRACKLAGLTEIACIVLDRSNLDVAELSLIENIQRENLNPVEVAMAYQSLMTNFQLTQEEVSERVGKSRSSIANTVRILELPEPVLALVSTNELSLGHAKVLLGLSDPEDMILLGQRAAEAELSVRQLELEVKRLNRQKKDAAELDKVQEEPLVDYLREIELRIQRHIGRRATISEKGRKKTLTLYYEDNEDLDELLEALCGKDFLNQI